MGSVWRRLGAEVTVVEFLDRITPGMDTEIANNLQRIFKKQGMKFKMGTKVMSASVNASGGATLVTEPVKGGDAENMDADIVLVSTGRIPYTKGLVRRRSTTLHARPPPIAHRTAALVPAAPRCADGCDMSRGVSCRACGGAWWRVALARPPPLHAGPRELRREGVGARAG
jgi:hypothetical protein